jgi:hypothetical protein
MIKLNYSAVNSEETSPSFRPISAATSVKLIKPIYKGYGSASLL